MLNIKREDLYSKEVIIAISIFLFSILIRIVFCFFINDYPIFNKEDQMYHLSLLLDMSLNELDLNMILDAPYPSIGMHITMLIIAIILQQEIQVIYIWLPIIIGSLTPSIFYLILLKFTKGDLMNVAIYGGIIYSIGIESLFRTTQGLPSVFSIFFLILFLWLFLSYIETRNEFFLLLMILSGLLCIFYHHLSSIFLFILFPLFGWTDICQSPDWKLERKRIFFYSIVLIFFNLFFNFLYQKSLIEDLSLFKSYIGIQILTESLAFNLLLFFVEFPLSIGAVILMFKIMDSFTIFIDGKNRHLLSTIFSSIYSVVLVVIIYISIIVWKDLIILFQYSLFFTFIWFGVYYSLINSKRWKVLITYPLYIFLLIFGLYWVFGFLGEYTLGSTLFYKKFGIYKIFIRSRILELLNFGISYFCGIFFYEFGLQIRKRSKVRIQWILELNRKLLVLKLNKSQITLIVLITITTIVSFSSITSFESQINDSELYIFNWIEENTDESTFIVVPGGYVYGISEVISKRNSTDRWESKYILVESSNIQETNERIIEVTNLAYSSYLILYSKYAVDDIVEASDIIYDMEVFQKFMFSNLYEQIFNDLGFIIWQITLDRLMD